MNTKFLTMDELISGRPTVGSRPNKGRFLEFWRDLLRRRLERA